MPTRERQEREAARRAAAEARDGETLYWCRWPSGFRCGDLRLDVGQVFVLTPGVNNETLIRLRYIQPVEGKPRLATCGVCGAQFLDDARREGHGRKRHGNREFAPSGVPAGAGLAQEDRTGVAEDRLNAAALKGEV